MITILGIVSRPVPSGPWEFVGKMSAKKHSWLKYGLKQAPTVAGGTAGKIGLQYYRLGPASKPPCGVGLEGLQLLVSPHQVKT